MPSSRCVRLSSPGWAAFVGHDLRLWLVLLAMLLSVISTGVLAVQPDEVLSDPALEARARTLSRELRCMVCQNQSIDDSEAPLARDLRVLVRERLRAGDGDGQVLDFLEARYGEFVLLKPRFSAHTLLLWLVAPGLLTGGAIALAMVARRRIRAPALKGATLSPAEEARLAEIVDAEDGHGRAHG